MHSFPKFWECCFTTTCESCLLNILLKYCSFRNTCVFTHCYWGVQFSGVCQYTGTLKMCSFCAFSLYGFRHWDFDAQPLTVTSSCRSNCWMVCNPVLLFCWILNAVSCLLLKIIFLFSFKTTGEMVWKSVKLMIHLKVFIVEYQSGKNKPLTCSSHPILFHVNYLRFLLLHFIHLTINYIMENPDMECTKVTEEHPKNSSKERSG